MGVLLSDDMYLYEVIIDTLLLIRLHPVLFSSDEYDEYDLFSSISFTKTNVEY